MPKPANAGGGAANINICPAPRPGVSFILSEDAVAFVASLAQTFSGRVTELLALREERQRAFDRGARPAFLKETEHIRRGDWTVAPPPGDLTDRRVEITGPVDRKMVINALNSGAKTYMADFEDSNSPTFDNCISGQANLYDAVRRNISFTDPASGKSYQLSDKTAVLIVRPRGWHLLEKHMKVDGRFVPASLFDFGLYFFHNARELILRGTGPYFYLPKMQSHLEARLWNDVFEYSQRWLGIPSGTIRATVLIETLPAAFEMHEILYELRRHSTGLNCGRWDYIFSFIKTFREQPGFVMPDRGTVTMEQPFLRAYTQLLIQTCHRRGAHAMGGMAAQIPIKNDPAANDAAFEKVRMDKLREVTDGHDGTWVAHPALVSVAMELFDKKMPGPNQVHRLRDELRITEEDLIQVPRGRRTEKGLRQNINIGIQYIEAWLRGSGCVPLYHLMEDAATAEISRTQVWQWIRHGATLDDGRTITKQLVESIIHNEMESIRTAIGGPRFEKSAFVEAGNLFTSLCMSPSLAPFLTLQAYDVLTNKNSA